MTNKNNIFIGIGLLAALVLIVGGFMYIDYINENSVSEEISVEDTEVNTPVVDNTQGQRVLEGEGNQGVIRDRPIDRTEEIATIESGDYEAWLTVRDINDPITQYIENEADFLLFIEMEEARQNQDNETVESIMLELGIPEGTDNRAGGQRQPPIQ